MPTTATTGSTPRPDGVPDTASPVNLPTSKGPGLCLGCDYPLRDLPSNRCPECGRPFDASDPSTVNTGPPLGHFGRFVLRPIGWPMFVVMLAPFVAALWLATDPQLYYLFAEYFLCAAALLVSAVVGVTRLGARSFVVRGMRPLPSVWAPDRRRWRLVARLAAAAVLAVVLKVPMRLAFFVSQPALALIVRQVSSNPSVAIPAGTRAGLYEVLEATDYGANDGSRGPPVILICTSPGGGGFRYSPQGLAHFGYNPGDEGHLWGPWYWYSSD